MKVKVLTKRLSQMVPLSPPLWEMNSALYRCILGEATVVLKFRHSCRYLGAETSCFSSNHGNIRKYQTDTTVYSLQQGICLGTAKKWLAPVPLERVWNGRWQMCHLVLSTCYGLMWQNLCVQSCEHLALWEVPPHI